MSEVVGIALAFVLGFVGSMPLTGPVALLVFTKGLQGRYRDAVAAGIGGSLAESGYCAAALAGLSSLMTASASIEAVVRIVAVPVLVLFGGLLVLGRVFRLPTGAGHVLRPMGWARSGAQGFLVSLLNPVLALNWTACATGICALTGSQLNATENVLFVAAAGSGVASWFVVLTWLLRRFEGRLPLSKMRWLLRSLGAVLVALGIGLGIHGLAAL